MNRFVYVFFGVIFSSISAHTAHVPSVAPRAEESKQISVADFNRYKDQKTAYGENKKTVSAVPVRTLTTRVKQLFNASVPVKTYGDIINKPVQSKMPATLKNFSKRAGRLYDQLTTSSSLKKKLKEQDDRITLLKTGKTSKGEEVDPLVYIKTLEDLNSEHKVLKNKLNAANSLVRKYLKEFDSLQLDRYEDPLIKDLQDTLKERSNSIDSMQSEESKVFEVPSSQRSETPLSTRSLSPATSRSSSPSPIDLIKVKKSLKRSQSSEGSEFIDSRLNQRNQKQSDSQSQVQFGDAVPRKQSSLIRPSLPRSESPEVPKAVQRQKITTLQTFTQDLERLVNSDRLKTSQACENASKELAVLEKNIKKIVELNDWKIASQRFNDASKEVNEAFVNNMIKEHLITVDDSLEVLQKNRETLLSLKNNDLSETIQKNLQRSLDTFQEAIVNKKIEAIENDTVLGSKFEELKRLESDLEFISSNSMKDSLKDKIDRLKTEREDSSLEPMGNRISIGTQALSGLGQPLLSRKTVFRRPKKSKTSRSETSFSNDID